MSRGGGGEQSHIKLHALPLHRKNNAKVLEEAWYIDRSVKSDVNVIKASSKKFKSVVIYFHIIYFPVLSSYCGRPR